MKTWWVNKWRVQSNSRYDMYYTVSENDRGEFGCSCPVWKFSRKECVHIELVKKGLEDGRLTRRYTLEEYLKSIGLTMEDYKNRRFLDEL